MNSNIIKHQRVIVHGSGSSSSVRAGRARADAACASRKAVRLVEHEGQVRGIELTCDCGESTLIELVFEATPARAAATARKPS